MQITQITLPGRVYKRFMPSLKQDDCREIDPALVGISCTPVSTANIFIYLAKKNRRRLIPNMGNKDESYIKTKLLERLVKLMDTKNRGTNYFHFLYGLKSYVLERGYKLQFRPSRTSRTGIYFPTLDLGLIMQGVTGSVNSILQLGYYCYDASSKLFKRAGGHDVTLSGFDSRKNWLMTHDPNEEEKPIIYEVSQAELSLCKDGTNGYLKAAGLNDNVPSDLCILEGSVAFEIQPK